MLAYTYFPQSIQPYPKLLLFDWFKGKKGPDPNRKDDYIHPGLIGKAGYTVIDIIPGFFRGRINIEGVEYPACCDIRQCGRILINTKVTVTGIKMGRLKVMVH